jgi:hypothetical protein
MSGLEQLRQQRRARDAAALSKAASTVYGRPGEDDDSEGSSESEGESRSERHRPPNSIDNEQQRRRPAAAAPAPGAATSIEGSTEELLSTRRNRVSRFGKAAIGGNAPATVSSGVATPAQRSISSSMESTPEASPARKEKMSVRFALNSTDSDEEDEKTKVEALRKKAELEELQQEREKKAQVEEGMAQLEAENAKLKLEETRILAKSRSEAGRANVGLETAKPTLLRTASASSASNNTAATAAPSILANSAKPPKPPSSSTPGPTPQSRAAAAAAALSIGRAAGLMTANVSNNGNSRSSMNASTTPTTNGGNAMFSLGKGDPSLLLPDNLKKPTTYSILAKAPLPNLPNGYRSPDVAALAAKPLLLTPAEQSTNGEQAQRLAPASALLSQLAAPPVNATMRRTGGLNTKILGDKKRSRARAAAGISGAGPTPAVSSGVSVAPLTIRLSSLPPPSPASLVDPAQVNPTGTKNSANAAAPVVGGWLSKQTKGTLSPVQPPPLSQASTTAAATAASTGIAVENSGVITIPNHTKESLLTLPISNLLHLRERLRDLLSEVNDNLAESLKNGDGLINERNQLKEAIARASGGKVVIRDDDDEDEDVDDEEEEGNEEAVDGEADETYGDGDAATGLSSNKKSPNTSADVPPTTDIGSGVGEAVKKRRFSGIGLPTESASAASGGGGGGALSTPTGGTPSTPGGGTASLEAGSNASARSAASLAAHASVALRMAEIPHDAALGAHLRDASSGSLGAQPATGSTSSEGGSSSSSAGAGSASAMTAAASSMINRTSSGVSAAAAATKDAVSGAVSGMSAVMLGGVKPFSRLFGGAGSSGSATPSAKEEGGKGASPTAASSGAAAPAPTGASTSSDKGNATAAGASTPTTGGTPAKSSWGIPGFRR